MKYDVIVIGGGHAGVEAAMASSRLGVNTLLITPDMERIAMAPCNPSIGGPAKGIVVREVDALGGLMGEASDATMLQIKTLNSKKGPAVHALRAQIDIIEYPKYVQKRLSSQENLTLKYEFVNDIIFEDMEVKAVVTNEGTYECSKVILTTGTYLDSHIIKGSEKISSGPMDTKTSNSISLKLKAMGVELFKLKTGTPARVKESSLDFSKGDLTSSDEDSICFSNFYDTFLEKGSQVPCHLIYTSEYTHSIIRDNIGKSAMYSGVIEGVGPRYCPSIEDKITRFADKNRHQLFLEPESKSLDTIYVQGFSTSMPEEIQLEMLQSLPGFENVVVEKYGYAIEYDAINPTQLHQTLEMKDIKNFYTAGQINGTSGYEEAAGQGLIAGINAGLSVLGKPEFTLSRMNSYIGLMIDDLITKGTEEPYRLLTSRSEYRLLLRNDNADIRLTKLGYEIGVVSQEKYDIFKNKEKEIHECLECFSDLKITNSMMDKKVCEMFNVEPVTNGINALDLLKRPNIDYHLINHFLGNKFSDKVCMQVEIETKYKGYIDKVIKQIGRQDKLFKKKLSSDIDYNSILNLALEAREKLSKNRPDTLGHAALISGINPSDISVLEIYLEQTRRKNE